MNHSFFLIHCIRFMCRPGVHECGLKAKDMITQWRESVILQWPKCWLYLTVVRTTQATHVGMREMENCRIFYSYPHKKMAGFLLSTSFPGPFPLPAPPRQDDRDETRENNVWKKSIFFYFLFSLRTWERGKTACGRLGKQTSARKTRLPLG